MGNTKTDQSKNMKTRKTEKNSRNATAEGKKGKENKRSRTVTGVLALLFGSLGIHKFYKGEYGKGVLYLLFFWSGVPSVFSLMEGVHLLSTDEDSEELRREALEEEPA